MITIILIKRGPVHDYDYSRSSAPRILHMVITIMREENLPHNLIDMRIMMERLDISKERDIINMLCIVFFF